MLELFRGLGPVGVNSRTTIHRLYAANVINTFGSWLTFLALALITQERYGTQFVAIVFLVQTLPAIFLSRSLARLVPEGRHSQVIIVANVLSALNCLMLVLSQNLWIIFIHLLVASLLRTLSGPLLNSMVGKWVPAVSRPQFFVRLWALQAGTLALAPVCGAWLKMASSVEILFIIDALTFLIFLSLQKELFGPQVGDRMVRCEWRALLAEFSPRPSGLSGQAKKVLRIWFTFLSVGAALNAIEFPGFAWHQMDEKKIAWALAAWGLGNLVAVLFPASLSHKQSAFVYLGALALFVAASGPWAVISSFAVAGAVSSFCAGSMRARLQDTVAEGDSSASLWAYANQITQMINLVAYALAGSLLGWLGFLPFAGCMLLLGTVYFGMTLVTE